MNSDLKKVGLVFKADGTTDFIKSLQTINGSLKENYSQFKLVQTEWDNSTKTSQKLKDKLDYLNNAYDLQKEKVNLLTAELKELENAEERDEKAIQNKRIQLNQAETKLASYKNQIKETSAMLKTGTVNLIAYGKSFEDAGKLIEEAGKKTRVFSLAATSGLTASVKSAIDFEDAFAGVEKTVDATDEQLEELRKGILKMSTELPATTTEISAVAEAAGQLGIQTENILSFTKTMVDLGESTNLSASEAADALARFANITGMSQKDFDKLGSTIVDLGNNCATTESEIVDMALRIAGAGTTIGMSEADIMSFAAAISSVGIEAEMGGSAISKMMIKIESAVAENSEDLKKYAEVAGMSAKEFKKSWEEDATGAILKFIEGLGNVEKNGGNLITTLNNLDIQEVRLRDTMLRLANSSELFSDTVIRGNVAWEENNALSVEASKRYETLKSKIEIALNKVKSFAINLGTKMMPSIEKIIDKFGDWVDAFSKLDDKQVDLIIKIGLVVAAASPLITIVGKLTSAVGGTISAIGTFSQALKVSQGQIASTNSSVNGLASIFTAIRSPIGLACTGIAVAIAAIKASSTDTYAGVKENFDAMGSAATDFLNGIESASSHISSFNTTLFATNEEQQKLSQNMKEIQDGINEIAKRASDERRGYTDAEIKQLDSYFEQLRALKDKELEIQKQIGVAITQQAQSASETFSGSLEEYKVLSQEWIKTAQDQASAEIEIINQRTIEEIALLNTRYGEKAVMENEEYAREYNAIISKKEASIQAANDEVAKVNAIYSNGYTSRATETEDFMKKIQETNSKISSAEQEHAAKLKEIQDKLLEDKKLNDNNFLESEKGKNEEFGTVQQKMTDENVLHANNIKNIWKSMYESMSESEAEQLGSWLALVAQTELYGGDLDEETKKVVDDILESFDSMPSGTKKAMENAMSPMLDEMKKKEPSLFAKASDIANGILSRLRKSFDIHSPSRKTRAIFQNVMKGSELGLEDEEKKLYKQTEKIANNVKDSFDNINPEIKPTINGSFGYPTNSNNSNNYAIEVDYDKMAKAFLKALNSCKLSMDKEGFIKFIQNVIYEVM